MPKRKLTNSSVKTLAPEGNQRQTDYWDTQLPCFGLRVSYGGAKTWIVTARIVRKGEWSKPQRIALGRYPGLSLKDAREKARETLAAARSGKDPKAIAERALAAAMVASRQTFDAMADRFLDEYVRKEKLRQSTAAQYRNTLKFDKSRQRVDRFKHMRHRPIAEITKQDIRAVIQSIEAPYAANRTLAYLKRFFSWCVEQLDLDIDPTKTLRRDWKEAARERPLSDAEIAEIWPAIEAEPPPYGPFFKLTLLTAQRRGEVAGMRWPELRGLERNKPGELVLAPGQEPAWEIPGERTKNARTHWVPLSPQAVAVLKMIPRTKGTDLIFPSSKGDTAISGFSDAKQRVESFIAGARAKAGKANPMPAWHVHDFRTTASTRMHEIGIQPHVVEAVLNHISGHKAGVAGVYNRAEYREPKRRALEAWAAHIDLATGKSSGANNVSKLRANINS